ncbi:MULTISPECIES: flavin-containing monooxygenase [Pseudomonas]|jgi:acetone monooxygenase|nr:MULTISPECIES: NAD(P)/FAD-dependent oxidoreductase [Pseudomonas]MDF3242808.1 NAD(P)/FAD-dependent oxidoreductase [Pseudomonas veronii]NMX36459.1 NAD(P)/FAD-dependent oxidoreductase [Pseudomonas veronii]PMU86601.1 cyclohexanone monooxygenase [Pseudomonas sp. GW704-F3]PMU92704.1 cyclohexanone monooxygenase [Pseudomonas sp. GW704-F5]PMV02368.1 cyclohexanone monooxygenase [Pseudomonas sp. MPBD4-3]
MSAQSKLAAVSAENGKVTYLDAMVIGAGVAGLYQLYRLREMGLTVRAYDTASGVGGTWYWNRYPGARFDSQAEIYQYWFSEELYKSWQPTERFPAQPETEQWLNFVANRLDLKKDIQFNTRIAAAHFCEESGHWRVTTEAGETINTQYLISCCGMLSAPLSDRFPGQTDFNGQIYHTGLWPKDPVDFNGKRVAVVGTGATGIQVIQTIAPAVGSMKVFVRTPQYVIPMRNPKYSKEDWEKWGTQFHQLKKRVRETFAGFDYDFDAGPWAEKTPDERQAVLEQLWEDGSLAMWLASFPEMFFDEQVNEVVSEFVRIKMRERLQSRPDLCNLLIPTDYGFGTHRVPLESKYLEVYLQPNVEAVDCKQSPIERIVPEGIQTADGKIHEVDIIVLAVGFDAGSGALSRIDIRGRDNRSLREQWKQEIRTSMGLQIHGYPNLFTTGAPLAPSAALCNMTTCLQQQVDWITGCIEFAIQHGKQVVEASKEFEDDWVQHHDETAAKTLVVKTDSWYMGSNVDGKPRRLVSYIGGVGNYHRRCDEIAAQGYPGFEMA